MAIKSKKIRYSAQERKKFRIRKRVSGTSERPRLTIFKSGRHTYAQAIIDIEGKTLATASTRESEVMGRAKGLPAEGCPNDSGSTKSTRASIAVGLVIAERLKAKSISRVVFDRNGCIYHGRVKAVADGAREGGLEF